MPRYADLKRKCVFNFLLFGLLVYVSYRLYLELSKGVCFDLSIDRTNKLLRIIQDNEARFKNELNVLGVPEFYKLLDRQDESKFFSLYRRQLDLYCMFEDNYFAFNQEMIVKLDDNSRDLSFRDPVVVFPLIEPMKVKTPRSIKWQL